MNKVHNVFLIFSLLLLTANTNAQQKTIDSLYAELKKNPDNTKAQINLAKELRYSNIDSTLIIAKQILKAGKSNFQSQAYGLIANFYHSKGITDSARLNYQYALSLVNNSENEIREKISLLTNFSNLMYFEGKYSNAIDTLNLLKNLVQKHLSYNDGKRYLANITSNIADIYKETNLPDKAIPLFYQSLQYSKELNDENMQAASLSGLGKLYFNTQQYYKSIDCYQQSLALATKSKNTTAEARALYLIGSTYLEMNLIDSAEYYSKKAIVKAEKLSSPTALVSSLTLEGQIAEKKNDLITALGYYKRCIPLEMQNALTIDLANTYQNMGDVYAQKKEFDSSLGYYKLALKNYKSENVFRSQTQIYSKLLKLNLSKYKNNEGLELLRLYDTSYNSFLSDEKVKAITAQEIKYETSLKEATIKTQQTELKAKTQQRNWLIGGGLFALLAATSLGLLYRRTRNQKERIQQQNTIIEKQKQEILHSQSNSFRLIRSMFRRQSTSAMQTASTKANDERLFAFSLLHELLYNDNGNHTDLKTFLQKLCDARAIQESITINTNFPDNVLLKADTLRTIGIIINELISNAVKHAFDSEENRQIDVLVQQSGQILNTIVKDNGKGLPPSFSISNSNDDGFGLGYVKDLAEQFGGSVKASNENGAIFEISIKV